MDYHQEIQTEVNDPHMEELSERELCVLRYVASACIHSVAIKIKSAVENQLIGKIHEAMNIPQSTKISRFSMRT